MAGGSLNSRKLAQFAGLADGTQARTFVRRLNELYDREGSAFRVEEVAGGFQLMTRPEFGRWLRRLHDLPVQVRLSTPAMETLSVVAYRQPVLRAELESVRGVQCGEMLRQLSERGLVRIVGRSPELGRPFLYGTTKRFLQVFGLRSLDELPRAEYLRQGSLLSPSTVSRDTTESQEESAVKIAIARDATEEETLAAPEDGALPEPRADIVPENDGDDYEDEFDDLEDEDEDDDDDDDDDEDDFEDDDLEEDEWEEVEDDEDWDDDDEDWDDDDEDWGEDDEEEDDEKPD